MPQASQINKSVPALHGIAERLTNFVFPHRGKFVPPFADYTAQESARSSLELRLRSPRSVTGKRRTSCRAAPSTSRFGASTKFILYTFLMPPRGVALASFGADKSTAAVR